MANPDQKTILIYKAFEEIKSICINLQKDTDASNSELKTLLKLIINEWEEKEEEKTGFGFRWSLQLSKNRIRAQIILIWKDFLLLKFNIYNLLFLERN